MATQLARSRNTNDYLDFVPSLLSAYLGTEPCDLAWTVERRLVLIQILLVVSA